MPVLASPSGANPDNPKKEAALERRPVHVGKQDAALHEKTKNADRNRPFRVAIWLRDIQRDEASSRPTESVGTEASEEAARERTRRYIAAYQSNAQEVVERVKKGGGQITSVSRLAPLVFAVVRANQLDDLESMDKVDTIYEETTTGGVELDIETTVQGATKNWSANIVGLQARACVVEADGIAAGNPHLAFGEYFNPSSPNIDAHANFVAGVIQSTANPDGSGNDVRGMAWGALPILSGNSQTYAESALVNATEWCVADNFPRAHAVNHSYFTDASRNFNGLDRYLDHVQRAHGVLQVKSAGNRGTSDGHVTSPGKGWNTLTVGSIDDKGTVAVAGDSMSNFSSFVDPLRPGQSTTISKPEVSAIGCQDSTTSPHTGFRSTIHVSPWTGTAGCGTSYAAPAVVGEALMLYQVNPTLKAWPEPTKAIIMASATQNVEGVARYSDKDGAGRINAAVARQIAANKSTTSPTKRLQFNSFNPSTFPTTYTTQFSLNRTTGQRIRCAAVWDSAAGSHTAGAAPTTDDLLVDMDLRVVRASDGATVASSTSINNAFEIVDVKAPTADSYHVQLARWGSSSETSNFLGVACMP